MVHYNQLRGLLLFFADKVSIHFSHKGASWSECSTLYCTLNIGLVYKCMFRTHSVHHDANSPSLGEYELLSHTYSTVIPCSIPKYNTMFHCFQPSHTPFCVKDSDSRTHTVNSSNHKTNMPRCVWFSFYLFKSYHHHMYSILTLAHPEHCSFVRPCR